MLETAHALIKKVAQDLGLTPKQTAQLLKVDALHQFTIKLKDGRSFKAYRAQHNNKLGPYKGGVRFHPEVTEDEVIALATLMSLKTAAVGLPLGGGKGGITVDPKLLDLEQLEELSRAYVKSLLPHIGPDTDIPAPDVNTNPQIMDWMVDEYSSLTGDTTKASFTGKSLHNSGSQGRNAATGRGGVIALAQLLTLTCKADDKLDIAIQGFGNVGSFFALVAAQDHPHWRIVAVSDSGATLYNPQGLDIATVAAFKQKQGRFSDATFPHTTIDKADAIISTHVDVLVLAALDGAVTKHNAESIKAPLLVELANGPIDEDAYQLLIKKSTVIMPDIIANAGGVIVSYLEWLQNKRQETWTEKEVNRQLTQYMTAAVKEVYTTSMKESIPLKDAAFRLALKRLAKN